MCKQQRKFHRQRNRFILPAIIAQLPFRGLGVKSHFQGKFAQSRLYIPGCRGIIARPHIPPVPLGLDEQIFLSHIHEGFADARINPIVAYAGGGLVYTGIFGEEDQAGFAVASAHLGGPARGALAGSPLREGETTLEATYSFVARDWLAPRVPARFRRYDEALARRAFLTVFVLRFVFWMPPFLHVFFGVSRVSFATLALIGSIALLGPLLALPQRWHLPVLIGELAAGVAFGETGLRVLHARNGTFTFLADIGFGLIMYVAGSRVPVRDPRLRTQLKIGAIRAVGIGAVAVVLGVALAAMFNTGHAALYAVLIASSRT